MGGEVALRLCGWESGSSAQPEGTSAVRTRRTATHIRPMTVSSPKLTHDVCPKSLTADLHRAVCELVRCGTELPFFLS